MSELSGTYASGYTMTTGENIEVISGHISFDPSDCPDGHTTGTGRTDNDGHRLGLTLETSTTGLVGQWREVDLDGEIVCWGNVEFIRAECDRLVGLWSMEPEADEDPKTFGTWVLSKLS